MPVSKRLRYEILRRDNHACRYCGGRAPDATLTVDHVVPVALGGGDDPSNLVAACKDCNSGKSSVPVDAELVVDVGLDAFRWAAAMRRAAETAQLERDAHIEVESAVLEYWTEAKAPYRNETYADYMPGDWYLSVQRWLNAGLTKNDLTDAAHLAIYARRKPPRDAWLYFCGICWRMLDDRQKVARALIESDDTATAEGRDA